MSLSICIRCGSLKSKPTEHCKVCGLRPQTDDEKAKSLILSLDYEIDDEYRGKSKGELMVIGEEILEGKAYSFDPAEVDSVIEYAKRVQSISGRTLVKDLFRWLGPPMLILLALYVLLK